ncbi:hypothetical protein LTR56_005257 [Elasticomyces elasticus]|nr:hypothetical protein LTR56_005257 [Elasticomyces elasticus]KAK3656475.1 hypothetical protein LTR22_009748 [Elasticomyces elasticus]KAK4923633.1 hypothetical protein LTR49_009188 [Elasticomyces elasticus]KAK5762080.1 hypothetical protein LTS12_007777 [Elasticomyces elasticus]
MLTSIKPDNAVLLFPDQVRNHQNGDPRVRAVEAFTIVITKFISVRHDAYCATIAYHDGCFKRVASGSSKVTVVEALQSLLDTTTLALTAALPSKMVSDRDVEWVGHGGGAVMGVRVTPGRSEANAVILFPEQVSNHQEGNKHIPATAAFTVIVSKAPSTYPSGIFTGFYRAYLAHSSDTGLERAANGGFKSTVVEALRSLLDSLAIAVTAIMGQKMGVGIGKKRVKRGDGEVVEGWMGSEDEDDGY